MVKILHIGLGKAGSSFLQKEIFPKISEKFGIQYFNRSSLGLKNYIHHPLENQINLDDKLPESFIISEEALVSPEQQFININKNFQYLKKNFKKDTKIFIVLISL